MAGYWRAGGHDELSEPDRPERIEQRAEQRAYGEIDPDKITDEELLSFFGYKNWDEWRQAEEEGSDEPLDLNEPDEQPAHVQEAMEKSWRRAHPDRPATDQESARPEELKAEHSADAPTESEQPEQARAWKTIAEESGAVKSYSTYDAAKRDIGTMPGTHLHHIVEQSQAKPERSGFDVERINTTDNITRIPIDAHRKVSGHYGRHIPGTTETLRNALSGTSWDYQTEVGREVLDKYMEGRSDDR